MNIIKGFPTGADGRVHGTFTHNPSSLRLSMVDPNLQNIPRGVDSEVERWVKECFSAPEGSLFWARDFSGIEARLVGYFAGLRDYYILAGLGVHAFLASHILGRPAELSWGDDQLKAYFKEIKKEKSIYDKAKRTVHASNYMVTPKKLTIEYPEVFPTVKSAASLQDLYFDLFPGIRKWHKELCHRVDGTKKRSADQVEGSIDPWTLGVCHVVNPFGYVHRFYNVLDWDRVELPNGQHEWFSSFGEDAKRLISFFPQSTAAAIIKRAAKLVWYDYPDVGQTLRLLIHDEMFGEAKEGDIDHCLEVSRVVMEAPIPELPLDPTWELGEYVTVGSEAKVGRTWATMR